MRITFSLLILCFAFLSSATPGEEGGGGEVVSTPGIADGAFEVDGFAVVQVNDLRPAPWSGDLSPPLLFEIVRPDAGAVSVGRILSSCTCLAIRTPRRDFARGERAFIELRNIKPTPAEGATYAFFVQLTAPREVTLRFDVFVKSEQRPDSGKN